ncbi:MAG: helix-turn-helix transcriptional regulator [Micromonosporaceae bacterium]
MAGSALPVTVVVGVDGAGRSRRLGELVAAAGGPAVRIGPGDDVVAQLAAAHGAGALVVVDDAHRLDAGQLRALAAAARTGVPMLVSRRPTIDRAELAELDEALAAWGAVTVLGPLDAEAMARLVAEVTGTAPSTEAVAAVLSASAGLPLVATAVASGGQTAPALVARVQRRLAGLDPGTVAVAHTLALRLDLGDDVLAAAAGLPTVGGLAPAMRVLRDEGLLVPDGEAMIPAVAEAVLADLPPAQRRRVHDAVARALVEAGAPALVAAQQLRAARAWTPAAAEIYRAAGEQLRFADPAPALTWFEDAVNAGAAPAAVAAGRAEAAALLGLAVDPDVDGVSPTDAARLALVHGAVAAHQVLAGRCAATLAAAAAPGPALAVPSLVATGQLSQAGAAAAAGAPVSLARIAEAARAMTDPAAALPLFIEAAEALERAAPEVVLPDTPHALGALMAVAAGDVASAEHLLQRAQATQVGGPAAQDRHRLLLGWVRLRAGRYDTAVAELRRVSAVTLAGRERLLLAALTAGVARRGGDIARLREAWDGVEQALARGAVDLSTLEVVEELIVAAARVRRHQRAGPILDELDAIVRRLGDPPVWTVALGWIRLQVAVAVEDAEAAAQAAARLATVEVGAARPRAQCAAAQLWARALTGEVDPDGVIAAADDLATAELPWEASRLAGQAAIRTVDPAAARRLLERARDLASAEVGAGEARVEGAPGGLSERELEVARMVLDGATYREIGARLFITPKTVEHHVARIRTTLGATSRAEFVAALREALA